MYKQEIKLGNNSLTLHTGLFAKQANASVVVQVGDVVVLATICCSSEAKEGLNFVPLQVEYNEKYYAAGKIPGGFFKREGRPKEKEILVSRLIDRPMRPLFSKSFGRDIQVIPTVMSADGENPQDVVAMLAAFTAAYISDIPFEGPVAGVRVVYKDGDFLVNPTFKQIKNADLEIIVCGGEEGITMVEGGGQEVSEVLLLNAIEFAHTHIKALCQAQRDFVTTLGIKDKLPLMEKTKFIPPYQVQLEVFSMPLMEKACFVLGKLARNKALQAVRREILEKFSSQMLEPDKERIYIFNYLEDVERSLVRKSILTQKKRSDGRGPSDIRAIESHVSTLPRTHGSALFTRGETQVLGTITLASLANSQTIDDIDTEGKERFMLHYNFPPYSVGETGRLFVGRREVGHGYLARRSLMSVLPKEEHFPYTIRTVAEVLESNGSSSMATVCASSLALLDAGVPLKKPVGGIAMGMVAEGDDYVILSDILGEEDFLGDMDFKVAGTEDGITGFQMDIKISKVGISVIQEALAQAKEGRLYILGLMNKTLSKPRRTLSPYAPIILKAVLPKNRIGEVIGSGGKNIRSVAEEFSVLIDITPEGKLYVSGENQVKTESALQKVLSYIEDPEVGRVYKGVVKRIEKYGAFIEILPGRLGLCHISRISDRRVESVLDYLKEDQVVDVKVVEIDKTGRIDLSIRDV